MSNKWFRRTPRAAALAVVGMLDSEARGNHDPGTLAAPAPRGSTLPGVLADGPAAVAAPLDFDGLTRVIDPVGGTGGDRYPSRVDSLDDAWRYDTLEQGVQLGAEFCEVTPAPLDTSPWSLVSDPTLPGGALGGVPFGGGLPGNDGPFLGPDTPLAEMPWRAAGGEAHPMACSDLRLGGAPCPAPAVWAPTQRCATRPRRPAPLTPAGPLGTRAGPLGNPAGPLVGGPDDDTWVLPAIDPLAADPGAVQTAGVRLAIFERLVAETATGDHPAPPNVDWSALLAAAWDYPGPGSDPSWASEYTERLPAVAASAATNGP